MSSSEAVEPPCQSPPFLCDASTGSALSGWADPKAAQPVLSPLAQMKDHGIDVCADARK